MRRTRKVKILATLGPASNTEDMIRKLFEAGADVFRINMSHSSHDMLRDLVAKIRNVEAAVLRGFFDRRRSSEHDGVGHLAVEQRPFGEHSLQRALGVAVQQRTVPAAAHPAA